MAWNSGRLWSDSRLRSFEKRVDQRAIAKQTGFAGSIKEINAVRSICFRSRDPLK